LKNPDYDVLSNISVHKYLSDRADMYHL